LEEGGRAMNGIIGQIDFGSFWKELRLRLLGAEEKKNGLAGARVKIS